MILTFVVLSLVSDPCFGAENLRVPLTVVESGSLRFTAPCVDTGAVCYMVLYSEDFHRRRTLRIFGDDEENPDTFLEINLEHSDFVYRERPHEYIDVYHELVPAVGPVSLRQHNDQFEMILNSTDEFFNSSCLPESILDVHGIIEQPFHISVSDVDNGISANPLYNIGYFSGDIGSVPEQIFARIVDNLISHGALRLDYAFYPEFANCIPELVWARLPHIEYLFANGGRIVVSPDEYMEFREGGARICRLKMTPCYEHSSDICHFYPLGISNIHIRFLPQDTVQFCDSL